MRAFRAALASGVTAALFLALPATAPATIFCVNNPACPSGPGNDNATIQDAIDDADVAAGRDEVQIAAGGYASQQVVADDNNAVDIVGAGRSDTLVGGPAIASAVTFTVREQTSTISNLKLIAGG